MTSTATKKNQSVAEMAAAAADSVAPVPNITASPAVIPPPAVAATPAPIGPPPSAMTHTATQKQLMKERENACAAVIGKRARYYMTSKPGGKHYAAIIVDATMNGSVCLKVFGPGGGEPMDRRNVRHASDHQLETNIHYQKLGCWDYMADETYSPKFMEMVAENVKA
jgi:hypothetical protein